jgi:putative membrane protein
MAYVPYCGSPPLFGQFAWNNDPILIACLVIIPFLYFWRVHGSVGTLRGVCFAAGWLVLALALVSPLCNLSVALFSARVGQHMVLALVAAPLLALGANTGIPSARLRRWFPSETSWALLTSALFAVALWVWHAPRPYEATFESTAVYWLMHLTAFGSALLLWHAFFTASGAAVPLIAGGLTVMQMSLLGALLTFARQPLYAPHMTTTWSWGLSPLEDQQLGGLIMWIPGGVLLTGYGIVAFGLWMRRMNLQGA